MKSVGKSQLTISRASIAAFKVGDKVRTRGDMGGFKLVITKIHNDHYCTAKGYGKERHFNMGFLEHNH
jgi:hypothetical protein